MNELLMKSIEWTQTFKYSLASSLCSSKICFEKLLFGSNGSGRRCGSNIKCTESRLSSALFALACDWLVVSLGNFDEDCGGVAVFSTFFAPISDVDELFEQDGIAFVRLSVVVSLSLLWLFAAKIEQKSN